MLGTVMSNWGDRKFTSRSTPHKVSRWDTDLTHAKPGTLVPGFYQWPPGTGLGIALKASPSKSPG
jgi:hypothetical protein